MGTSGQSPLPVGQSTKNMGRRAWIRRKADPAGAGPMTPDGLLKITIYIGLKHLNTPMFGLLRDLDRAVTWSDTTADRI